MATTKTRLIGDLRLQRTIAKAKTRLRDMREALGQVRDDYLALEASRYGTGAPTLSPAYAAWKAKHFPAAGALVASGRLRAAATGSSTDFSVVMNAWSMRLVISVPYAIFHAKYVVPLEPQDLARWTKIIDQYLSRAVKA